MHKPDLTFPELMFVVATRGMLAAGAALLIAGRLSQKQRRLVGGALVAIGAVTTVPALMAVIGSKDRDSGEPPSRPE
mgnify:CR=1 FL=1